MRDGERKGEKCWSVVRLAKPFSYYMIRIKDVSIEVSICLISWRNSSRFFIFFWLSQLFGAFVSKVKNVVLVKVLDVSNISMYTFQRPFHFWLSSWKKGAFFNKIVIFSRCVYAFFFIIAGVYRLRQNIVTNANNIIIYGQHVAPVKVNNTKIKIVRWAIVMEKKFLR